MNRMKTALCLGGLATAALILPGCVSNGGAQDGSQSETIDTSHPLRVETTTAANLENAFQAIAERAEPAVVSIRSRTTVTDPIPEWPFEGMEGGFERTPRVALGAGSGFIIRPDGWILTNDHVVANADEVTVRLDDGREFKGQVRRDFRSDLAVVKIDANNLPTLPMVDSKSVRVGSWAIAYGSPFGLDETMTVGIVSAMGRETTVGSGRNARFYPELLQTDASINPGNSGGPLLNLDGEVMGVNVAIGSPTGSSVGIGFAIPSSTAQYVVEQLIEKGTVTRGYLGFVPENLTEQMRTQYRVQQGALVISVQEGSPAAQAGLQVEDVVTAFNGQPVTSEAELRRAIVSAPPGSAAQLTVNRRGREMQLTARVGTAPNTPGEIPRPEAPPQRGRLGVEITDVTPDVAQQLRLPSGAKGVVIAGIQPGSPAALAGLQPGDLILRLNDKEIAKAADVSTAMDAVRPGETVSLVVRRGDARILARLEVG